MMKNADLDFLGSKFFDASEWKLLPGAPQDVVNGFYEDLLLSLPDRELTEVEKKELEKRK